jgi:ankyrin repeat protein
LLTDGVDINGVASLRGERTALTAAVAGQQMEMLRLLAAGVDVNYRGESDWTPISKAATWGCPRAVKLLLEKGADANTRKHTYTTLSLAKTPEIADLLFAAGADVNAKIFNRDVHGISYCVTHGSKEMVQWFFDHGVDPAKVKDDEPTLLFSASSPEIVDLLVARGVDIHAKDEEGRTALIWALQMRTAPAKVVTALLKHGADPNVRMKGGYTPLMQAEDGPSVDALVASGADLHAVDDRGNGVLYTGWGSGIPSRIEALRRHGLKLDPVKGGELLRNAVILQGDVAAVKRLLAMGIDPNAEDFWEGRPTGTALNAAISRGKFKIAEVLRAAGANDVGLLSEASAKGDLPRMTALLDGGAGVNDLASNGETPLHFAVQQGQIEAVKLLLARGANVDLFTSTGYTALDLAGTILGSAEHSNYSQISRLKPEEVKSSLKEIIAAIRERKPDPNFRNSAGETALMASAAVGGISGLKSGMDINAHRPDGMTALMIAIATQPKNAPKEGPGSVGTAGKDGKVTQWMSARAHFVKTLLANGADVTLRNNAGQTALDLARENGNEEILGLLEKKP